MIVDRLNNNGKIEITHKIDMRAKHEVDFGMPEQQPLIDGSVREKFLAHSPESAEVTPA